MELAVITNLKNHVPYSAEQIDKICHILPDDEIRWIVERKIAEMKSPLKSMILTWEKERAGYRLKIILTEEVAEESAVPETRCVNIGYIDKWEYDALNSLIFAGRRLFFRLRKDFPMLRRKLSTYRFPCT